MKNKIDFIFLIALAIITMHLQTSAQIILNQQLLPKSTTDYEKFEASLFDGFVISPEATESQQWNYQSVFDNSTKIKTQVQYQATNLNTIDSIFPNSTLLSIDGDGTRYYYQISNTGFHLVGLYHREGSSILRMTYSPNEVLIPIPFKLKDTISYTSGYELSYKDPRNDYKVVTTLNHKFKADAFGSLTTPLARYENTLRVKKETSYNTQVFVFYNNRYNLVSTSDSSSIEYNWYRNHNEQSWVLRLNADVDGVIRSGMYLNDLTSGIAEAEQENVMKIYPNPSNLGRINLNKHLVQAAYELTYINGAAVKKGVINGTELDVSGIDPGLYYLKIGKYTYKINIQ